MKILLHPTYFPDIATFAVIAQNDIQWEVEDNYQKQTYRNRCYVCTDQGRHMLSIPIQHVGGEQGRQKYKDVLLDNSYPWQREHWRTLQTAYRTSPFFEFYEDDIAPLYENTFEKLMDFNLKTIALICDCLQIQVPSEKTSVYQKNLQIASLENATGSTQKNRQEGEQPDTQIDARFLVNAKKSLKINQDEYVQVFGDRHGFIENVSVLDLLFNEGTNALTYLGKQNIDFLDA